MPDLNLRAAVEAERAKYPAMLTEDQPAKILNAVALAENKRIGSQDWGLSAKPHGNHVPSPQGVFVAYDILHNRKPETGKPHGRLFDCLTGDLQGIVTWGETSYHGDPVGRPWVAPVEVGQPSPQPTPEDPIDPVLPSVIDSILKRLAVLEGQRRVSIRTHDGKHYLCAEGAGGGDVNATRTGDGPWETFTLIPKP